VAKIKYTKNELKAQKDSLKRYSRYLPTLELKRKQLQTEINKVKSAYMEVSQKESSIKNAILSWIEVFGEEVALAISLNWIE